MGKLALPLLYLGLIWLWYMIVYELRVRSLPLDESSAGEVEKENNIPRKQKQYVDV